CEAARDVKHLRRMMWGAASTAPPQPRAVPAQRQQRPVLARYQLQDHRQQNRLEASDVGPEHARPRNAVNGAADGVAERTEGPPSLRLVRHLGCHSTFPKSVFNRWNSREPW